MRILNNFHNKSAPQMEQLNTTAISDVDFRICSWHMVQVSHVSYRFQRMPLSPLSHLVATIILLVSILLATPGNILVMWVVIKTPFLRCKAVNMLIVNLCLIDLVATCIDSPLIWIILQLNANRPGHNKWICNW